MIARPQSSAARPLRLLFLAPLAAGSLGALVMVRHGASISQVGLQVAALVVGTLLSAAIAALGKERLLIIGPWAAVIALALLGATLLGEGLLGVRRWLPLGPVRLHASSIACPVILVGAAALLSRGRWAWGCALLAAAQLGHWLQPDAGQATALSAGGIAGLVASRPMPPLARALGVAALSALAAPVWMLPDPLPAVPIVEGIVGLAGDLGLLFQALAIMSLVLLPGALALAARRALAGDAFDRAAAAGLVAYVAAILLVPLGGNFPVPVMGFGVSPILGVAVCVGVVARVSAARRSRSHHGEASARAPA
jgi:cell division protein FtsW (lipid II flippase)